MTEDRLLFKVTTRGCGIDNIGWLVVYHKNRDRFREIDNE